METNGTYYHKRNGSYPQNENQNAEETEEGCHNDDNNVHTHPGITMLSENSRIITDKTLKAESRSLLSQWWSYQDMSVAKFSPSNNQTANIENGDYHN